MVDHRFHAELWEHSPGESGSFHFLTLPPELSDDIAAQAGPRAEDLGPGTSCEVTVSLQDLEEREAGSGAEE